MKLLSLQLDTQFNSLQPFGQQQFPYFEEKRNIIEPICFIGANGSGKSNLLELISEIFFYIEREVRFDQKGNRKVDRSYILEYLLFNEAGESTKIKIDSTNDGKWKMLVQADEEVWNDISNDYEEVKKHLPEKIVGYTSGLNETLSYRFAQLNADYAALVREAGFKKDETDIPDNRLIFVDYDSNASILVANYLLKPKEDLDLFEANLRIKGLEYFKIFLDFEWSSRKFVELTKEHKSIIEKFKSCSTTYHIDTIMKKGELIYKTCIFEFVVNDATKQAFKHNFTEAYNLFMAFQKLSLLNNLKLKKKYRYVSGKGVDQMPPKVGFEERIFRFDEIQLRISSPEKVIPYIGISDGEHQFIEVVGSIMLFTQRNVLFLYDEPETHFNPQWRSKLVSIINDTTKDRYQEMVQTTHSPFVVSDCKGYNVFKFWREGDKVGFSPIGIETFGTSIVIILKEVFGKNMLISELARQEINDALISDDINQLQKVFDELGESRDRELILEKINKKLSEKQ